MPSARVAARVNSKTNNVKWMNDMIYMYIYLYNTRLYCIIMPTASSTDARLEGGTN